MTLHSRIEMKKIWIATGDSESSDHYVEGWWDHRPTEDEVREAFSMDEEWPFVYWDIHMLEKQ